MKMTVEDVFNLQIFGEDRGLVNDLTEIKIVEMTRKTEVSKQMNVIAAGKWTDPEIQKHMRMEIESFVWKMDNTVWIRKK
ncbi:MAG: hypothetical protein Q4B26_03810 [Eubacteriales bacterium]|nr:hypothetical protein [Eubacteriales bacterium]